MEGVGNTAPMAAPQPAPMAAPGHEPWADRFLVAEDLEVEDASKRKSVYLVTLPALRMVSSPTALEPPADPRRVCPSGMTHEEVAKMMIHTFQNPVRASMTGGLSATLNSMAVFRERHAPAAGEARGAFHWHVAIRADDSFRFLPYKRALQQHDGVASHWSTSHMGYWSAVRYGVMPSPKKPQAALDEQPLAWSRDGPHPPLFAACQQPNTASAMQERREKRGMVASEQGEKEPWPTEFDLYPIIVQNGFKNTPDDPSADKQLV